MPAKSLLLIDDDMDDHAIFSMALSETSESIAFDEAYNGTDALQKLSNGMTSPNVIFLDVNMPVLNGFDTLKELKTNQRLKHIPVVMYSTSNEPHYQPKAKALGAMDYIKKPSSLRELCEFLKTILPSIGLL
jgi:CheY-like chemotaxis protein